MRSTRSQVKARRDEVVRLVLRGATHVDDLSRELRVSRATVRRDLAALEASGYLSRTYGGAKPEPSFTEIHLRDRMTRQADAKGSIGKAAARLLPESGVLFVDAGSSCAALIANIPREATYTVVTRSLEIAILLADWPGIKVVVTGGEVAHMSHGLVGPLAQRTIGQFRYDAAFLGVDAVDPVDGVGEPTLEEVATKELAAERSRRVIVLADHSKLAPSLVSAWAPLTEWTLVTDEKTDDPDVAARLAEFRDAGVNVVVSPTSPDLDLRND